MKYNENQRVKHATTGDVGIIKRCINSEDKVDVAAQGYRYEVLINGWLWSIPEHCLQSHGRKSQ
jgi:hypothetical protein